jgi:outer membrane protease
MLYGQANEEVYDQVSPPGPNYKLSELIWPFHPLVYAGVGLDLDTRAGLFASLDVEQGFPGKVGSMTDSDYLDGDGVKTNFSQSDSYIERFLDLGLLVGYDFIRSGPLTFGIFGAFEYQDFKFSARDGYTQYPSYGQQYYTDSTGAYYPGTYPAWSPSETETPIYGTLGLYEQVYILGSLGLKASYSICPGLSAGASFALSPLLYCYTEDDHELRQLSIYGKFSSGLELDPKIFAEYSLKPGATLRLDLSYRWTTGLIGSGTYLNQSATNTSSEGNYYAGPDSAEIYPSGAGASISMLDASLSFRLDI